MEKLQMEKENLQKSLESLEKQLEESYSALGKKAYAYFSIHEEEEFAEMTGHLQDLLHNKELLQAEIHKIDEELKKPRACPICGKAVIEGAKFCYNCGGSLKAEERVRPVVPEQKQCIGCGAPLKNGARFCGKCGRKL